MEIVRKKESHPDFSPLTFRYYLQNLLSENHYYKIMLAILMANFALAIEENYASKLEQTAA